MLQGLSSSPLIIGGDGLETERQASFAIPGPYSLGGREAVLNIGWPSDHQCLTVSRQASVGIIYNPPEPPASYLRPRSPYNPRLLPSSSEVHRPPNHLADKLGASCFHCGRAGHWRSDCPHTKGVANPNLQPPSPTPL
ncbi:hypothetical protein O181_029763 [Austropuccinia psidii MF-1]|uniref:CCHC-type domain-containing protein n=1 Tax=Austropuccinia psidii MF-1 TaxID=1389203 RepID=A0A9Q3CWC8_9BASI|nr:hypothetical protein [Austropuccinia psidii MF-1]